MYGWRARIGLIVPSSNTTMEEEFRGYLPRGVSMHIARVRLKKVTVEELEAMEEHVVEAAERVSDAGVDIIVFGCTTGSLIKGLGYDIKLSSDIKSATGVEAITTSTAVIEALKTLSISKVSVATPYIDSVNLKEKVFLENNGIKVVRMKGLGIEDNLKIGRQSPEVAYKLAKEVDTSEAKGIFISCTNFRTFEIIEPLERDLNKPVISSNQATLWLTLRKLNIKEEIKGLGTLLLKYL